MYHKTGLAGPRPSVNNKNTIYKRMILFMPHKVCSFVYTILRMGMENFVESAGRPIVLVSYWL